MYNTKTRSFNHAAYRTMPEWQVLVRAVGDLAEGLDQQEIHAKAPRAEFADLLVDLALSTQYGDACTTDGCGRTTRPYKVDVDETGESLLARYYCEWCDRTWTCGWAVMP